MSYRRPDSFDLPPPKLPMSQRVQITDPAVTRRRTRRQMLLVVVLAAGVVAFVRRDFILAKFAGHGGTRRGEAVKVAAKSPPLLPPAKSTAPGKPPVESPLLAVQAPPVPQTVPESLGAMRLDPVEFPAEESWPRQVSLQGVPRIEVGSEDAAAGEFIYRSPHYEFRSDTRLGPDVVREFARVFEATHLAVCKLPLDFRPAPENLRRQFTARLYKSDAEYLAAGGMEGSAGCYKRAERCILVPLNSLGVKVLNGGRTVMDRGGAANATLIHEITHQMMNHWLPRLPVWYAEGAAEYMVVGDYLHGRFNFGQIENLLRQYLTRRRSLDGAIKILRPGELMALDSRTWSQTLAVDRGDSRQNYLSALLLTFYFYHLDSASNDDGMVAYLRAIESGVPAHDACRDHLMRGRSVEMLEGELAGAFKRLGLDITFDSRKGPVSQAGQAAHATRGGRKS